MASGEAPPPPARDLVEPTPAPASDSPPPPADLAQLEPAQRVSFYVQAVDDMLDKVLDNEAFLFSDRECAALTRFRTLDYQSRYLFARLLLRKPAWIRLSSLQASPSYTTDIKDLPSACADLWRVTEPVAGPSKLPPPVTEDKPKPAKEEREGFLDLTLTDSDDDMLPLPRATPLKGKSKQADVKGKGKARVVPRKLVPDDEAADDDCQDLSRFAFDTSVLVLEPPETTLALLSMEELTTLGKRMKVAVKSGATRGEWTKALLKTSNQSTLSFFLAPSPPAPASSAGMERKPSLGSLGVGFDERGNKLTQSSIVARQALKLIGPVILLSPAFLTLFNRLSLVYHRTSYTPSPTSSSASPLTASLLARFGKRTYPSYVVSRSFALFPSRAVLRTFEAAMRVEQRLEVALEGAWGAGLPRRAERETPAERKERYEEGCRAWEEVEGEWRALCAEAEDEMRRLKKEEEESGDEARCKEDERRRLYYRRRFHPGWPLSRAAYKAAACYAKLGDHDAEVVILRHLLSQTSFRRGKRGDWYDRLALVLMKYPLGEELRLGGGGGDGADAAVELKGKKKERKDRLLRERREEAKRVCEAGLADPYTHLIYKSSLQRRIARIESALSVPVDDRTTFDALLAKSAQRVMEGERVDVPTIGKKSVWRRSDGDECSVEELCLEQYTREGWKGFHSENGVLTMIFALTFWDILFAPVDGVFETEFQTAPLDLATDAFAIVRRPAITARLAAISDGSAPTLLKETDERERPKGTFAVGTNWDRYSQEDLLEIVDCVGGPALAAILTVFVEDLWNPSTRRALFAEIKGPGDQLSETQKVWIDVLLGAGVGVEVVRVVESREGASASVGEEDEEEEEGAGSGKKRRKSGGGGARDRSRSKSAAGGKGKRAKTEEMGDEGEGE
ncbi:fanconi-associated nuclease 1 [Rhodotorula paludigena]|uniref:fanconi-associated nuclease 1 n=1 Tax=Rhodotorula paludigena TaxID=86838 RepID=UPI0031799A65